MSYNEPSSGDYAWSAAQENVTSLQDCMVLIGWLAQRVTMLEQQFNLAPIPFPAELPSQMHGFASIPRRAAAATNAIKQAKVDAA